MASPVDISSLKLENSPSLQNLPPDLLHTILTRLDTAQSVAHLGATCKRLREAVASYGWRTFVKNRFKTLALLEPVGDSEWAALADKMTWQSRAWDRRAFVMVSLLPPSDQEQQQPFDVHDRSRGRGRSRGNGRGYGYGRGRGRGRGGWGPRGNGRRSNQTLPPHAIVDACLEHTGNMEKETLVWGLGEDVMVRWKHSQGSLLKGETWRSIEGAPLGYKSGPDDVTAISVLKDTASAGQSLLVGRASGELQLLSANQGDFGRTMASFVPTSSGQAGQVLEQNGIQHFATSADRDTAAVITKSNLFIYPLLDVVRASNSAGLLVESTEALDIGGMTGSSAFLSLRQVCFMGSGDLALCVNRSTNPVRYVTRTPSGTTLVNSAKMRPTGRCTETLIYGDDHLHNARGLMPVNMASVPGGSGSAILSSYDDGTVRLQDVRTPASFDAIYQDHFELVAPMGPLVAHGMERFIVGSARAAILKVFDFRWTNGYCYTEALRCSERPLEPRPKSLTSVPVPPFAARSQCSHVSGRPCVLHASVRTDFYRPNCNAYLPALEQTAGPVYSLAKPSDLSPAVYAGLTRGLIKMGLRDPVADLAESTYVQHMGSESRFGYSYEQHLSSIVETGDGIGLADISKSNRLPFLYKQKTDKLRSAPCKLYRLDESLM
ncbi:f-box domain containing protein [Ophiostoma piceae UAMH 11346]|uniref:F-box domain containing protein n=1 Tax=Ophiostoma piceae (strain UAMH 11346) TaxID=1262450 RepID=S3CQ74_OPHP1|nr:f-box domain containing protein [Ophiostoma piceae UAMH 11346]